MAKLVDDDVIDDRLRGHHAFPMEGEVSIWGTGGPAVAEFADADLPWSDSDLRGEVFQALGDALTATADVVIAKRRLCSFD